jgi:hypothetical protein
MTKKIRDAARQKWLLQKHFTELEHSGSTNQCAFGQAQQAMRCAGMAFAFTSVN